MNQNARWTTRFLAFTSIAILAIYLSYHLLEGELGIKAWNNMQQEFRQLSQQVASLKTQRDVHKRKVKLLTNPINRNFLEETIRRELHYVKPNEIIIVER